MLILLVCIVTGSLFSNTYKKINANAAETKSADEKVFDSIYDTKEGFAFGSGNGSGRESAYLIATPEHLDNVRNYAMVYDYELEVLMPGHYFRVVSDIDLTDFLSETGAGYNEGKGWESIDIAASTFDGGGFTIKGLWINRPLQDYVGLFARITDSFIADINIALSEKGIIGKSYVGGITGKLTTYVWNKAGASISGCSVSGNINAVKEFIGPDPIPSSAGLIAGAVTYATISECKANGTVIGVYGIGGIAGTVEYADIVDCIFDGNIVSTALPAWSVICAGGIAGVCYGNSTIKNCFNSSGINADERIAAIAGYNGKLSIYKNEATAVPLSPPALYSCYFKANNFNNQLTFFEPDEDVVAITEISRGLSAKEVGNQNSFTGWDFDNVWVIKEGMPDLMRFTDLPPSYNWLWITLVCAFGVGVLIAALIIVYKKRKVLYITETITIEIPPSPISLPDILTAREKEIAELIIAGKRTQEMLDILFISSGTLKRHISNIFMKTEVTSQKDFILKYALGVNNTKEIND